MKNFDRAKLLTITDTTPGYRQTEEKLHTFHIEIHCTYVHFSEVTKKIF